MKKQRSKSNKASAKVQDVGSATANGDRSVTSIKISQWKGPVLPPEILRGYNDVIENGAERLIRQWELEGEDRRAAFRREQHYRLVDQLVRRLSALIFALSALGVASYSLSLGFPWAAVGIGGGAIALVVTSFLGMALRRPKQ